MYLGSDCNAVLPLTMSYWQGESKVEECCEYKRLQVARQDQDLLGSEQAYCRMPSALTSKRYAAMGSKILVDYSWQALLSLL